MNLFQHYLAEEFAEDYAEGRLSRREALKLIASVTGSLIAANSILASCAPPPEATETSCHPSNRTPSHPAPRLRHTDSDSAATEAPAPAAYGTVMPDDPAIIASEVQIPAADTNIHGLSGAPVQRRRSTCDPGMSRKPRADASHPGCDAAVCKGGLCGSRCGPAFPPGRQRCVSGRTMCLVRWGISPPDQFVEDFKSGWRYLQGQTFADAARVGMTGFCFGGGVTWRVATQMPELLAAVPFYGPHPPLEDVPNIQAAVLAIYGELDSRINAGIPAIEQAMMENNKIYEKMIYQGADHAFHNDTGGSLSTRKPQEMPGRAHLPGSSNTCEMPERAAATFSKLLRIKVRI